MTIDRETVIRLAREAGFSVQHIAEPPQVYDHIAGYGDSLERFSALVLEHGRIELDRLTAENEALNKDAERLLFALKACAAVCAGETPNKSSLINALELARDAILASKGEA